MPVPTEGYVVFTSNTTIPMNVEMTLSNANGTFVGERLNDYNFLFHGAIDDRIYDLVLK